MILYGTTNKLLSFDWISSIKLVTAICNCNQEVLNYKIAVRPDRRRQFENELASGMEMALNVLTACLNINELTEQVGYYS